MITEEQTRSIIEECKILGAEIKVRDIAFVFLSRTMAPNLAYQCLWATTEGFEEYENNKKLAVLKDYMTRINLIGSSTVIKQEGITFEDNRKAMEQIIRDAEEGMQNGTIEPKDALKIIADVRVKLNDKFKVTDENKNRMIIVEQKFNAVCDCGREIYKPTKEDLMKEYNLVEKQ